MDPTLFARVDDFLTERFHLEDQHLQATETSIRKHGLPEHSISAVQGQFLYLLARMCKAKRIVEIGTLGGYSTIWLARALEPGGHIDTIELDPKAAALATENLQSAGLGERVTVHLGDALDVLKHLEAESKAIDLFFMDADKPNYVAYFDWALSHVRSGGLILADNVIREGKVLDSDSSNEKVLGVQRYLSHLSDRTNVVSSVLQQVGSKEYDGLAISLVN